MRSAPLLARARARAALLPIGCAALAGYFAYHAVIGETGLLAWGGYRAEHARLEHQAASIHAQRTALEHRVALLNPAHVDPDLADELVRKNLNVVRPDEVVVPLPAKDAAGD